MKILIGRDGPHAMDNQRVGLGRAFEFLGHEVGYLDETNPHQIQTIIRAAPDLAILNSYNLNEDSVRAIKEVNCKTILRVFDNGPIEAEAKRAGKVDNIEYKIEFARPKDLRIVEQIAKNGNLAFMFNHYHEDDLDYLLGGWKNFGPVHSSMLAADSFLYDMGKFDKVFEADACHIGSYHPYKAIGLNPYIVDLNKVKKQDGSGLKVKIFSSWHWPSEYYCGYVNPAYNKDILKSSKISLNVSEPHSRRFGTDVIERVFYSLYTGSFLVMDYVERANKMFPGCMVLAKNPSDYKEAILNFLRYPDDRLPFMDKAKELASCHTYIDRAKNMLHNLGN